MARPDVSPPGRPGRSGHAGRRARAALGALALAALVPAPGFAAAADDAPLAGLVLDGPSGPVALDDYRGRWTYVDFYASWCVPCRASFPFMDALVERHADDGLAVLAIGLDEDPADSRAFAEALGAGFDVAFDPSGASAGTMGLRAMPSSYLLTPDGGVAWSHVGFRSADRARIAADVAALIGAGAGPATGPGAYADADGAER